MAHKGEQRSILFVNRLPVVAVKLRIIEILALNPPRLAKDVCPLGARIDFRFELRHVERSIAYLNRSRTIRRHDSPRVASLIEKFFLVG